MTSERRSDEQIRGEIASEREQLAGAVADLRAGVDGKRRLVTFAGAVVAAAIATRAATRVARKLRGS